MQRYTQHELFITDGNYIGIEGGMMEKINISDKMRVFDKYWQSKLIGEFNSQQVKLVNDQQHFGVVLFQNFEFLNSFLRYPLDIKGYNLNKIFCKLFFR